MIAILKNLLAVGVVIGVVPAYNWATLDRPVAAASAPDPRNAGISMHAYHQFGVVSDSLVVDIWDVPTTASMVDVDRVFFNAAAALKDRTFKKILLSWRGKARFIMDGAAFQTIGREHGTQNPVYVIRTMQEGLRTPDGALAFETWTGGMLGVMTRQMDDHKNFHLGWYGSAMFGS